ncbi:MAG TPA: hypothetical protein VMV56_08200 [Williamwhitmania sp.]|nr:hypothetical protein [Williamwhitmania sp.]
MRRWFHLVGVEWLKARSLYGFGITITAQLVVFLVLIFVGANFDVHLQGVSVRPFFEFPHVWETFAWVLGWLNFFTAIGFIVIVGSEFGEKTFLFQLVSGLTRIELVVSKILLAFVISIAWFLVLLTLGFAFGLYFSPSDSLLPLLPGLQVFSAFFLRTFSLLLVAMLIAFILRNTAVSILVFVVLFSLAPVVPSIIPEAISWMMPFQAMQNLTPTPDFFGLAVLNHPELSALKRSITLAPPYSTSLWLSSIATFVYSCAYMIAMVATVRRRSF